MKRFIAIALIVVSTTACAQHYRHDGYRHQPQYRSHNHNYAPLAIGALILGGVAASTYYNQPRYVQPQHIVPMYGNQCPIVNGYQTVPILQTNQYGYNERVGCGYPQ